MIKKYIFTILISSFAWSQKKDSIAKNDKGIDEIVISGTLKPVMRSETTVPVEIYTTNFLRKNPTSNLFEALQNINGVRPQLNCNICNTGDIHINGLEGPFIPWLQSTGCPLSVHYQLYMVCLEFPMRLLIELK